MTSSKGDSDHAPPRTDPLSSRAKADDWKVLQGELVEIFHPDGELLDVGQVDAVTKDGGVLWLAFEGAASRRLFERAAGVDVWIVK